MSKKTDYQIKGYFDYVVPPLEGFWWQEGSTSGNAGAQGSSQRAGIDYSRKDQFNFISVIRLPDFVTRKDFDWAIRTATEKQARKAKKNTPEAEQVSQDFSKVEFLTYDECLCVQCLHLGSYDDEPQTIELMHQCLAENGYALDIQNPRYHHEIYLSDPRRCQTDRLKTVIRHPIKPAA